MREKKGEVRATSLFAGHKTRTYTHTLPLSYVEMGYLLTWDLRGNMKAQPASWVKHHCLNVEGTREFIRPIQCASLIANCYYVMRERKGRLCLFQSSVLSPKTLILYCKQDREIRRCMRFKGGKIGGRYVGR